VCCITSQRAGDARPQVLAVWSAWIATTVQPVFISLWLRD
jgi:hypothetical protein